MAQQTQLATMHQKQAPEPAFVQLPAPTAWPIVLAFGLSLLAAGMVTTEAISVLGAILSVAGAVGWFRNVLPHEEHELVAVLPETLIIETERREVARLTVDQESRRAWLPVEIYPVSAGIKGGLAGSVVMALLAMLYGLISQQGIWYPVNLLAAGFFPSTLHESTAQIAAFHLDTFLIAAAIHLVTSLVVGLLYGAMLPMISRHPVFLGGFAAPIMWTGLLHSILSLINPVLNQRISWLWFVLSQVGFGIVAGIVVARQQRIHTWQNVPFAVRAGIDAPGLRDEKPEV
jgi:hypothetical protein